jgi:beta-lactamase regulating signal transducer with metallopeptidase domain
LVEVINWAWQGTLLVLVVSGYSRCSRGFSATARYRLWWATVTAIIGMPLAAVWLQSAPASVITSVEIVPVVELPASASLAGPALYAVWASWTVVALARLGVALIALRRMKRSCLPFPEERKARLVYWNSMRAGGRHARLALSPAVGSAAVLGGLDPIIAVSPALLRHLDDEDLDQIVLHEWAHVQRRDDVAQLVQQSIGAVLGLHPAVWWATRQLQLERELACDERVAQTTGCPKRYAACLARLATVVALPRMTAMIPALGPSQLTTRITRLVRHPQGWTARRSVAWAGAGTALVAATVGAAVSLPLIRDQARQSSSAMPSPGTQAVSRHEPRTVEISAGRSMMAAITANPRATRRMLQRPSTTLSQPEVPAMPREMALVSPRPAGPAAGWLTEGSELKTQNSRLDDALTMGLLPEATSLRGLPGEELSITAPRVSERGTTSTTAWSAAADAGVAIGRGSTQAARATAGFFTRMSKSIAGGI